VKVDVTALLQALSEELKNFVPQPSTKLTGSRDVSHTPASLGRTKQPFVVVILPGLVMGPEKVVVLLHGCPASTKTTAGIASHQARDFSLRSRCMILDLH
jgi:hypothetical protein